MKSLPFALHANDFVKAPYVTLVSPETGERSNAAENFSSASVPHAFATVVLQ